MEIWYSFFATRFLLLIFYSLGGASLDADPLVTLVMLEDVVFGDVEDLFGREDGVHAAVGRRLPGHDELGQLTAREAVRLARDLVQELVVNSFFFSLYISK